MIEKNMSRGKGKMTTAVINQELKDFKVQYKEDIVEVKGTLKEILDQAKKTNGRVTTLETRQNDCPAREHFIKGKTSYHIYNVITLIIAGIALFFAFSK